jgi:hypothetical protein
VRRTNADSAAHMAAASLRGAALQFLNPHPPSPLWILACKQPRCVEPHVRFSRGPPAEPLPSPAGRGTLRRPPMPPNVKGVRTAPFHPSSYPHHTYYRTPSVCVVCVWRGRVSGRGAHRRRQPSHPDGTADRRPAAAWPGVGGRCQPSLHTNHRWHRWCWRRRSVICVGAFIIERVNL